MNWNKIFGWIGITVVLTITYSIIPEMASEVNIGIFFPNLIMSSIYTTIIYFEVRRNKK